VELFIAELSPMINRVKKIWTRKLLRPYDVFTYNRTVPKNERGRSNHVTTQLTPIGGDKHGRQEKKESR